jgi:hypothetical protein
MDQLHLYTIGNPWSRRGCTWLMERERVAGARVRCWCCPRKEQRCQGQIRQSISKVYHRRHIYKNTFRPKLPASSLSLRILVRRILQRWLTRMWSCGPGRLDLHASDQTCKCSISEQHICRARLLFQISPASRHINL